VAGALDVDDVEISSAPGSALRI